MAWMIIPLVVKKVGFRHLIEHLHPCYCLTGRKYICKTSNPKPYKTVRERVSHRLKTVQAISFTTQVRNSKVYPTSWLTLTAHFTLKSTVLQANEFGGSHIGTLLCTTLQETLKKRHRRGIYKNTLILDQYSVSTDTQSPGFGICISSGKMVSEHL